MEYKLVEGFKLGTIQGMLYIKSKLIELIAFFDRQYHLLFHRDRCVRFEGHYYFMGYNDKMYVSGGLSGLGLYRYMLGGWIYYLGPVED